MKKYVCDHCEADNPCTSIVDEEPTQCLFGDTGTPEWIEQPIDSRTFVFVKLLLDAKIPLKEKHRILNNYMEAK